MMVRRSIRLYSAALIFSLVVVAAERVSAKSWSFSGDTNLCNWCPNQVRGNPLLSVNQGEPAFAGTIGGGLTIIENSRFDFMPSIPIQEDLAVTESAFTAKGPGPLSISATRQGDSLRFTDGRDPNGVVSMPEPATLLLMGTGLSGLAAAIWKRRRLNKGAA